MRQRGFMWPAVIGLAAGLVLLICGGYLLERRAGGTGAETGGKTVEEILGLGKGQEAPVYFNGRKYRKNPDVEAYLLMGVDKLGELEPSVSYNNGGQADVLLLLVVDQLQESFQVLQINRDTMVDVEVLGVRGDVVGTEYEQICLAHYYGDGLEASCENTVRAVSNLLYGIDIDGYASIQMEALPTLNDMVGGVTVAVEDDFSNVDPSLVKGETVTLQGEQALHFIRSRQSMEDSSNLNRMGRHREYLHGFDAAFTAAARKDRQLVLKMYDAAHDYMVTDMGSGPISRLAQQCLGYENGGVMMLEGEAEMGEQHIEFYPDEDALRQTILDLFYTELPAD